MSVSGRIFHVPIPFDVLIAATDKYLLQGAPLGIKAQKESETVGSMTVRIRMDDLGNLGKLRIGKLQAELCELDFTGPVSPTEAEGLTYALTFKRDDYADSAQVFESFLQQTAEGAWPIRLDVTRAKFREFQGQRDKAVNLMMSMRKEHWELIIEYYLNRLSSDPIWLARPARMTEVNPANLAAQNSDLFSREGPDKNAKRDGAALGQLSERTRGAEMAEGQRRTNKAMQKLDDLNKSQRRKREAFQGVKTALDSVCERLGYTFRLLNRSRDLSRISLVFAHSHDSRAVRAIRTYSGKPSLALNWGDGNNFKTVSHVTCRDSLTAVRVEFIVYDPNFDRELLDSLWREIDRTECLLARWTPAYLEQVVKHYLEAFAKVVKLLDWEISPGYWLQDEMKYSNDPTTWEFWVVAPQREMVGNVQVFLHPQSNGIAIQPSFDLSEQGNPNRERLIKTLLGAFDETKRELEERPMWARKQNEPPQLQTISSPLIKNTKRPGKRSSKTKQQPKTILPSDKHGYMPKRDTTIARYLDLGRAIDRSQYSSPRDLAEQLGESMSTIKRARAYYRKSRFKELTQSKKM